jgi:hypothetical protein
MGETWSIHDDTRNAQLVISKADIAYKRIRYIRYLHGEMSCHLCIGLQRCLLHSDFPTKVRSVVFLISPVFCISRPSPAWCHLNVWQRKLYARLEYDCMPAPSCVRRNLAMRHIPVCVKCLRILNFSISFESDPAKSQSVKSEKRT